jgi:alcohol dehydrogenase (cytochrome c)
LAAVVIVGGLMARAQDRNDSRQPTPTSALFKDFKPVTDAMLENPGSADWLNWRRTLDSWGYSPLKQINRDNVDQLQLVWSRPLGAGLTQPTPLVYNGVMYVPQPYGLVQALDAATGELIWEYTKKFETPPDNVFRSRLRSLAIYGDKIFVDTSDAHIIALNAKTGQVVWDHTVADSKLGYRYTSGPIVVKGKIVAGMTGCERYKDDICFISAHDPQTGKELWRTSTVARPGEPGGETWGDLPLKMRSGGDAWIPGSYDPKTNLIYWSTAQAKPWASVSRGTDGDALYTNSTLALNPETGKIVWYYQFTPGESHDLDDAFENTLIDHDGRSSLFKMGKMGILWELDRKTGKFVAAHDLGYQTLVEVNPQMGKVAYRPDMIPKIGVPLDYCPTAQGVRNWRATAYHPETQALYIPVHPSCTKSVFSEVTKENVGDFYYYGSSSYTGQRSLGGYAHPASPDHRGALIAMDIKTGKILWRYPMRTPATAAALTTAGGLVVSADSEGYLYIHDVATGKILFQTRLATSVQGFPVTYAVRSRQYLVIPAANRGTLGGAAIYVFALPARAANAR